MLIEVTICDIKLRGEIIMEKKLIHICEVCGKTEIMTPEEQLSIINGIVMKNDTFICLGDVGSPEYIKDIKARKKILILGNHDAIRIC